MADSSDPSSSAGQASALGQFIEFVSDAIVGVNRHGEITLVNQHAEKLFGYGREEIIGSQIEALMPERFRARHVKHDADYFQAPRTRPMGTGIELMGLRKDGTEAPIDISLASIELGGETVAVAAIRDTSDRAERDKREGGLRKQLERSRRLESVGQLAGGIAHDFNNILSVIVNNAAFVADELEGGTQSHEDVEEIRRAAERATALTRQLLIFGRRDVVKPQVLYLRDVIADLENLLRRALGERVELKTRFAGEPLAVEIDPGQIEQVLVNLAVNARDAMPEGGRLLIEVERADLDAEYTYLHPDTKPGLYVRLMVSDTGVGMDAETVDRVFEPFFTTKKEGTGLGLAMAYGIVTGAGGRIDVYSEPGLGTTVKVHLPATASTPSQIEAPEDATPLGHGEVVLVVEDQNEVRKMAERILTRGGYSVLSTTEVAEALEICRRPGARIDLLLTDVVMPDMLGTELVEEVRSQRPDLRVVYMSGYSHEVVVPQALAEKGNSAFIEKPFNAEALLKTVRGLLHRPTEGGESPDD